MESEIRTGDDRPMGTADDELERRESAALLERFIEFATDRGLIGPGGLPYAREEDGSLGLIRLDGHLTRGGYGVRDNRRSEEGQAAQA